MNSIKVSEFDFIRLNKLLQFYNRPELQTELERAEIINPILVTPDLVTVDSTFLYRLNNEIFQSTLVLDQVPEDQLDCVSVLDELGTALIGLSENQSFRYRDKNIHILSVMYQPEASGELHPICFH